MVRRLYFFSERVQWISRGQMPHTLLENLIEIALVLPVINGRSPTDTALSLRAYRLLVFPSAEELAGVNTLSGVGLPLHIATSRTNDFNSVLRLPADQNGCRDIARTLASVDVG